MTLASLASRSLPLPQCGSHYFEQRAPAIPAAAIAVTQQQGGGRRTSRKTSARLEFNSLLPPPFFPTALLKSAGRFTPEDATHRWQRNVLNSRPRSSSLENKIVQWRGCWSLGEELINGMDRPACLCDSSD
jgi:hypothetical protein